MHSCISYHHTPSCALVPHRRQCLRARYRNTQFGGHLEGRLGRACAAQGSSATSGAACEVQQPAVHGAAQEEQQRPLRMQGGAATAAAAAPLHPPPPAAHLTVRIKQAASVSDLAALLSQYGHAFNHIHISAALIAYHRLHPVHAEAAAAPWGGGVLLAAQFQQQSHPVQQQQQPVDQQVSSSNEGADNQLDAAQRQQPGASTSGAASSGNGSGRPMPLAVSPLASFDDASLPPLPPARALLAALLRLVRERLRDLDARGVSNVLWVLAARRYYDPALVEGLCCAAFLAANTMTAQHLATVVWSLARLGCRPAQPLLSRLVHNAAERLPRASGHDLAMLLWALPRLGERAVRRSVLLRIADAAGPLLAGASPGEAALMLNGLASARCWPGGPWMERFYAATLPGLARLSVQEAASLAWSLGVLAGTRPTRWAPPPHAWLQGLHDAAARHVGALGGADAAQMLFGFHACGMDLPQDSPLLAALFGSSSTSSSSSDLGAPQLAPGALDARSRVHLLMALASMGVQPPASWVAATLEATRERLPACGPSELAATLHALAGLGVQPGKEWLGACLEASEQQLGSYAPRELRCLLWALVRMGVQPPPAWLDALWVGSEPQLGKCAPQELISLAHSVVDLRLEPPAGWLGQLLQAAHAGTPPEDSNLPHAPFNGWSVRQLCTLCHGLAELGVRPSEPWLSAACARASDALVDAEPRHIVSLLGALGRLHYQPGPAWLGSCLCVNALQPSVLPPHLMGQLARALGTLATPVPVNWQAALVEASAALMAGGQLPAADCVHLLWCLARLGIEPPQVWRSEAAGVLLPAASRLSSQQLGRLVWSLAQLARGAEGCWAPELVQAVDVQVQQQSWSGQREAWAALQLSRLRGQLNVAAAPLVPAL